MPGTNKAEVSREEREEHRVDYVLTCDLQMSVKVSVSEQRFRKLSQKALEQRGHVVGVKVPGTPVDICSTVQQLSQSLLPNTVPRDSEKTLHVKI